LLPRFLSSSQQALSEFAIIAGQKMDHRSAGMCCFQTFQSPIQFDVGVGSLDALKHVDDGSPPDFSGWFFVFFCGRNFFGVIVVFSSGDF
jgi:hypothetical protein